ncbi:MAG TPA: hypothetical protein VD741_05360, partial [Solirubrobacterales bacterium]|nr:hypothetical protein [Solirubrobacterales bacterium]
LRATLLKLGHDLVNADTTEAVAAVEKEGDEARGKLIKLRDEIKGAPDSVIVVTTADFSSYAAVDVNRLSARETEVLNGIEGWRKRQASPEIDVIWRREGEAGFDNPTIYRDDFVEFQLSLSQGPLDFDVLELDFGDGGRTKLCVSSLLEQGSIVIPHSYVSGGEKCLVVSTAVGDDALWSKTVTVSEQSKIERERTDITDRDRIAGVVAFALAVASGMATLYFADASWGEPADYLAALAWGGITGEGVKLAANIADRKFPGG